MKRMRTIRAWTALSCLPIIMGCGVQLDSLLLVPSQTFRIKPSDLSYQYEEVVLPSKDGSTINSWHIRAIGERKGIVVVIPGADANKGRYSLVLPVFVDEGWDVVLYDYPGFGDSPGPATLAGVLDGTRAALDYAFLQDDVIVGYGVSMGAAVLARMAADYPFAACIFDSAGDLRSMGSNLMAYNNLPPELGSLADLIISASTSDDFDMKRWVAKATAPKLFLHSPDDTLIPWQKAWEVFKAAAEPKHMVTTQGDHAEQLFVSPELYQSLINGWLTGVLKLEPIPIPQLRQLLDDELRATYQDFGLTPKT